MHMSENGIYGESLLLLIGNALEVSLVITMAAARLRIKKYVQEMEVINCIALFTLGLDS